MMAFEAAVFSCVFVTSQDLWRDQSPPLVRKHEKVWMQG